MNRKIFANNAAENAQFRYAVSTRYNVNCRMCTHCRTFVPWFNDFSVESGLTGPLYFILKAVGVKFCEFVGLYLHCSTYVCLCTYLVFNRIERHLCISLLEVAR